MPHIAQTINDADLFSGMEKRKPELAAKCREEFRRARQRTLSGNATENSATTSTSSDADSQPQTQSGLPVMATMIPPDSPLVLKAEKAGIIPVLLRIGQTTGHKVSRDRLELIAGVLMKAGWTLQELEYAEHAILTDRQLLKQISFERTIGPGVFAEARETPEVRRGRLHGYQEAREYASERNMPLGELFEVARMTNDPETTLWLLK